MKVDGGVVIGEDEDVVVVFEHTVVGGVDGEGAVRATDAHGDSVGEVVEGLAEGDSFPTGVVEIHFAAVEGEDSL